MKTIRKREQKRRTRVGSNTCHRRHHRRHRHRKRSGGSTTEQIGAAAQMRPYIPVTHSLKNDLNSIVHHENVSSIFHDTSFQFNPHAQHIIDGAYEFINGQPRLDHEIKNQMKLARQKANDSMSPPTPSWGNAAWEFPDLPSRSRPLSVLSAPSAPSAPSVITVPVAVAHVATPHGIVYQHQPQHNLPLAIQSAKPTRIDISSTAALKHMLTKKPE